MTLDLIKDSYDRKARLYPALLVVFPLALTVGAAASLKWPAIESAGAALASCGGAFLLTQLARDGGKRREPALFEHWGGMPSVVILRHRDKRVDAITKGRYHKKLCGLVKDTKTPTAAEEDENPEQSDTTYLAWCTYLRTHTKDTKTFRLLFQENVNYGYRRNVWGMKPLGIAASTLSLGVSAMWGYVIYRNHESISGEFILASVIALALLSMWIFIVSPAWGRIAS